MRARRRRGRARRLHGRAHDAHGARARRRGHGGPGRGCRAPSHGAGSPRAPPPGRALAYRGGPVESRAGRSAPAPRPLGAQRLSLARQLAIIDDTKWLKGDEPAAGRDLAARRAVVEACAALRSSAPLDRAREQVAPEAGSSLQPPAPPPPFPRCKATSTGRSPCSTSSRSRARRPARWTGRSSSAASRRARA